MTNPRNDSIHRVLMLAAVLSGAAACGRPAWCAGGGDDRRQAIRAAQEARQETIPEPTDAAAVAATQDMDNVCRGLQIDLMKTVEHNKVQRVIKVGAAGGVGLAGYEAGTAVGHTLGPMTGLTHISHATATAGKLVAAKQSGVAGAAMTTGCGTLLPVGVGGAAFLATYMGVQQHQKKQDRKALTDVLREIRATPRANGDAMCLAACRKNMKATLYTGRINEDCSTEVSLYQRSATLEGFSNTEDALLYKCLPVHKIGLVTHGIYHSPLVPIHETLASLIAFGTKAGWTAATLAHLTSFFSSPVIPAAGFPICFAVYTACNSIMPKLYEDAAIAYQTLRDTPVAERPAGLSEDDFFEYRSQMHCDFKTLDHPFFKKEYPAAFRHIFGGRQIVRWAMGMNGPTYLEEMPVDASWPTAAERTNAAAAGMPIDTVAGLALYRAHVLQTSGKGQHLDALAKAIKETAEPNHAAGWSIQRLQDNFGLTFPTVASRTDAAQLPSSTPFDLTRQEGRLQYACYLYALATKGDVGVSVSLAEFNQSPFWGAPRSTNMWIGSEVFFRNERYRIESVTPVNDHQVIRVVLERINVDTMQHETVPLMFAAERSLEAAAHHGGKHGAIAGGILGGAGAIVATGGVAIPVVVAGGAAAAGGAAGTYKDYSAEATDAAEVAQLKIADLHPFFNDAAQFAWDIQYKSLAAILETLKVNFFDDRTYFD